MSYDEEFRRLKVGFSDKKAITELADQIRAYSEEHAENFVPSVGEAETMIGGAVDTWGSPFLYTLVSSRRCRVSSIGPDKTPNTRWDMGIALEFDSPEKDSSSWLDRFRPEQPWLQKRQAELRAQQEGDDEPTDDEIFVGGQSRLEGAPYFRFFALLMLGTAVVFLVVAKLYRPKEYLYDGEGESNEDEVPVDPVVDAHGG